ASVVAATMDRDLLGPQFEPGALPGRLLGDLNSVVADLVAAARYTARQRGPRAALGATGASKFLFGILSVSVVLLYPNYSYPRGRGGRGPRAAPSPGLPARRRRPRPGRPPRRPAAGQAGRHHAAAGRQRGGHRRAGPGLQPGRLPGLRLHAVSVPAGRGHLRD